MEIENTFSTIEEIKTEIEKEGFTFRFSFDEEEEMEKQTPDNEKYEMVQSGSMTFATESDPEEIEKWEAALPDIESEDETEDPDLPDAEETDKQTREEEDGKTPKNAAVLYFDLFKKRAYVKTLIFQKEETETGELIYILVGFCEAPMTG